MGLHPTPTTLWIPPLINICLDWQLQLIIQLNNCVCIYIAVGSGENGEVRKKNKSLPYDLKISRPRSLQKNGSQTVINQN